MTRAGWMRLAPVLLFAVLLYACGAEAPATPTAVPLPPTPAPTAADTTEAIPAIEIPGMTSSFPPLTSAEATPRTDIGESSARLGPPSWIKPGTRITYYDAAASVAESRFAWVEDSNGNWTDPTTGKRYRRTDESGEGVPTASGDGFSQIDVLAVEGTDVVLSNVLYGIDRNYNQFVPAGSTGGKVAGAAVDGAWINPTQLAQLETKRLDGLMVLKGDYVLNGTTYHAISFANTTPGAYQSYTYDTKTGLLIAATTTTAGPTSPLAPPGENAPRGNTQLTVTRLAGYRQRSIPGITGKNPDWLARTKKLNYDGTYNFTNPVDPTSANTTLPMSIAVTFGKSGKNWASYSAQTYVQYQGSQPTISSGVTGTSGLYWIDQSALKSLKRGQALDQDPWTGEKLTVQSVTSQMVTINSTMSGINSTAQYALSSGVLSGYGTQIASSGTTVQLQVQNRP